MRTTHSVHLMRLSLLILLAVAGCAHVPVRSNDPNGLQRHSTWLATACVKPHENTVVMRPEVRRVCDEYIHANVMIWA